MEILQACVETSSAVADQIGIDASFALSEQAREIEQLRAENKALKSTLSHYDDDSSPQDVLVQTCCDQVRDAESIAAAAIEQKDAAIALALQYEGSERTLRGMVQELESEKKDMVGAMVYKEIMQRTLKELDERGGSAKFLRSVGVTGLQLDSLRKVLVVPAAVASKM